MKEFDETEAVEYINSRLNTKEYSSDEILNIIDMIWDYYETNGMLEIDYEDEDEDDEQDLEEQLVDYVIKMLARDPEALVETKDVHAIVKAELEYEESLSSED